jgi:hypothetical protein
VLAGVYIYALFLVGPFRRSVDVVQSFLVSFLPARIFIILVMSYVSWNWRIDEGLINGVDLALLVVEATTLVIAFVWTPPFEKPWSENSRK